MDQGKGRIFEAHAYGDAGQSYIFTNGVDFLRGQSIEAIQLDCKIVGFFSSKSVMKSVKRGV